MKVVVLGGGDSTERDVSIRSAQAVTDALRNGGFEVIEIDPSHGLGQLQGMREVMVFPILHGTGGEDGQIQTELEKLGLPYLGTKSTESAICFDKNHTRRVLESAGLPIARGDVVTRETYASSELTEQPHVLKISRGGSSIGTYIVRDSKLVDQAQVDAVFGLGEEAVIEELVAGVEITVPVLGDQALPVIEIQPPVGKEFDYENKYNGATKEICPPVSIDTDTQHRAQELALQAHQTLGCRHLSRTDMIVRPSGQIVILETNTMPGMTAQSLLPLSAKQAGLDMVGLVTKFVTMVENDYQA